MTATVTALVYVFYLHVCALTQVMPPITLADHDTPLYHGYKRVDGYLAMRLPYHYPA